MVCAGLLREVGVMLLSIERLVGVYVLPHRVWCVFLDVVAPRRGFMV